MPRSIIIIGGGIIGTSIAYYLSRHPKSSGASIHVIEASSIAAGSSGKGGGFLASDWHRASTSSLGKLSFRLHEELAEEYRGADLWGYRKLVTLGISKSASTKHKISVPGVDWLRSIDGYSEMGSTSTTAQVHPYLFTNSLLRFAQEKGVKLTIASADGIDFEGSNPTAVHITDSSGQKMSIPATDVVLAAGPWTGQLAKRLLGPRAGEAAKICPKTRSTSIVMRTTGNLPISAHAIFADLHMPNGVSVSPEVYPRSDGTVYLCGDHTDPGRQSTLPEYARDVVPSEHAIRNLQDQVKFISSHFDTAIVENAQACFKPESETGNPIIGKLGNGLWIAGGHSVWGITNGPGTGKCMAELILDGNTKSADISELAP